MPIYIRYKTRTPLAKLYSFCWLSNLGQIYQKKLGPEGVMESGSHFSYTKTLEESTLVNLSTSPPNVSMMLVWNNLADPHLSAFSDFARFSQTLTLNCNCPEKLIGVFFSPHREIADNKFLLLYDLKQVEKSRLSLRKFTSYWFCGF